MSDTKKYELFFKRYYWDEILEFIREYPNRKTFIVDFYTLNKFNLESANSLIERPDIEIEALTDAFTSLDVPADVVISEAVIAIKGLPDDLKIPIHKIGQAFKNKLISVEGRVTRIAPQHQKLTNAAFKCRKCSEITFQQQPDEVFTEPLECGNNICTRKGAYDLIPEDSTYEDQQKIALQDLYESMKPGQPLREIIVVLRGPDMIASVPSMGAQCTITGIVKLQQKKGSSIFHTFLEAIYIEPKETEIDLSLSDAEKKEFKELAAKNNIIDTLINSTAPEILGYDAIKSALLCAIVSGADNPQFREYMHLILCGDPGTGKSALLRSVRALVPRAQYSAGRGSSVAGLTVAVVKDELSGSGYTAQAGALVLADNGLMVLDEADKLEQEDFQALNTALEESFIEVHKGGINQKFNTRCSVIALCNPKNIRFDDYEPLTKQIAIPGDTLSRFDLIFKIQDKPDAKKDRKIAEHQALQWDRYEGGSQEEEKEGRLSQEKLSKYLQHAKTKSPRTTPETREVIITYFLTLRKIDGTGTIATTARQNNGLYRLTKAIAKLRLSDVCTIQDVEKAIEIHQASLEAFRDPMTGKLDADIISGLGKSQRDRYRQEREIIRELQGSNGGQAHYNEIVAKAEEGHIGRDQLTSDLVYLIYEGEIIKGSNGFYRVV